MPIDTLPLEFIDTKNIPLSKMEPGVEYPVHYGAFLLISSSDTLWIRKDYNVCLELDDYEHESEQVYLSYDDTHGSFVVKIPLSFSRKRKWSRHDGIDSKKYRIIDKIIVE